MRSDPDRPKEGFVVYGMWARIKRTVHSMWSREPWWAEFWAGVSTMLWAIWPYMFGDAISDRPTWFVASLLLDAQYWQYGGFSLGALKVIILLQDQGQFRWLRILSCSLGAWFWCFLATSLIMVAPSAPSVALYVVPCLINVYSMIRLQPRARSKWAS